MNLRRTIIVHTNLSGHRARIEAARTGSHGVQILTMARLASRLAGGFLQPINPDSLLEAVRAALKEIDLGEFEGIKNLPGMARAAVATLDKIWRADIDISASNNPRLMAMRKLEGEALRRLPMSMKRPKELVELACAQRQNAAAVLGSIEIHGHSEMSPCWRPLLMTLATTVPVAWIAGARSVPSWLESTNVEIRRDAPNAPKAALFSCATPQHEALEAIRWMRKLIASGKARPEEIAICAASPAEFDDHLMALRDEANIPLHFVHGVKAVTTRDGQTTTALAEVLIKGLSQERVRRFFALLGNDSKAFEGIPREWTRILPKDAPLTTIERWEQVFAGTDPNDWPDETDRSREILEIVRLLAKGTEAAAEAGEKLLPRRPLALWRRAMSDAPAAALPVTLAQIRVPDGLDPAARVIWTSATSLASSPRPYVHLLSLNAGRWPRRIAEDRLIPDHIIPIEQLDPLPVADGDRRDFETIINSAQSVTASYSRRDVGGRLLGRSPLIAGWGETYLSRGRTPEHAASETDRLQARPSEFRQTPIAASALACLRDWSRKEITAHDGLVAPAHARLRKVFDRPMSATSLKLLLRDPIGFTWRYALGWKEPEEAEEPLSLDALSFGNLVHAILQRSINALERDGGFASATPAAIEAAVGAAADQVRSEWETTQPVPPPIIWRSAMARATQASKAALAHPLASFAGQKSWTEIPFGAPDSERRNDLPWDPMQRVEIPGAGVLIQGHIDRLDLSGDGAKARVIDYKTGRVKPEMADVAINGGTELQRCLYAFAVTTLLGKNIEVEAALLYPLAGEGEQALLPLADIDDALRQLADGIAFARRNVEDGLTLPGIDAESEYNDYKFVLPANPTYLPRKLVAAAERLGDATKIWEAK